MTSIRLRLLTSVLSLFMFGWIVVAIFAYSATQHEIEEVFDAELSQSAQVLDGIIQFEADHWVGKGTLKDDLVGQKYEIKISFQIWKDGEMLLKSLSASELPIARIEGYSDQLIDGKKWRVFHHFNPESGLTVNVAQLYEIRDELAEHIAWGVITPLFVALPLLGILFWFAITRGLLPLERVTNDVKNRAPEDMSEFKTDNVPQELMTLTHALNNLFERVRDTIVRERRFTSDAAHELRTPLAAIRTTAEVALKWPDQASPDDFEEIHRLSFGLQQTLDSLMLLARDVQCRLPYP